MDRALFLLLGSCNRLVFDGIYDGPIVIPFNKPAGYMLFRSQDIYITYYGLTKYGSVFESDPILIFGPTTINLISGQISLFSVKI